MTPQQSAREYLHDNLPRIERAISDYQAQHGELPGLVVLDAHVTNILALEGSAVDSALAKATGGIRAAFQEIKDRMDAGAYAEDVPIIVKVPGDILRTSLETTKMRLELEAMGCETVVNIGGSPFNDDYRRLATKHRFKERKKPRHR